MNTAEHGRGFSLMELMIVVAILGIIAAIALPNYLNQVQKSNRVSAKSALLDLAARQENYFALNNAYSSQLTSLGYATVSNNTVAVPSTTQNYYSVTIASVGVATPSYVLQATPVTGSAQATDACKIYQMDSYGNKSNVTTSSATVTTSGCW